MLGHWVKPALSRIDAVAVLYCPLGFLFALLQPATLQVGPLAL